MVALLGIKFRITMILFWGMSYCRDIEQPLEVIQNEDIFDYFPYFILADTRRILLH